MDIPENFDTLSSDARIALIHMAKARLAEEYPTASATGWNLARALNQAEHAKAAEQRQILEQIGKRYGL